jgi:predicted ATPase
LLQLAVTNLHGCLHFGYPAKLRGCRNKFASDRRLLGKADRITRIILLTRGRCRVKLKQVRIENFRSFKDETIALDDYTCLVGPNGAGKSAVLTALNVFFRNMASSATNVNTLGEEDFHHRNTKQPIKITLVFGDLSDVAEKDLHLYVRHGQLVVFAKADWDEDSRSAVVKQFGARLVMKKFAPFFEADSSGAKAGELKAVYCKIREEFSDLPEPGTKAAMMQSLRDFEEKHLELCELLDEPNQFYGWSKGVNLLDKYVQWVYVPAVKDASTEQEEGNKTALGQLLERTIRTKVNFREPIDDLKRRLETDYREIIEKEQAVLSDLQVSLEKRLRGWANPSANVSLNWHYDPNKSLVVNEPVARIAIGEHAFIGEVARLGHGMQRAFIVSMLQELAGSDQEGGPTLLLGFEEPELYQHPPQAQHIATSLDQLASEPKSNAQVLVSTHSPYFVSAKGFESVRVVRKRLVHPCSIVSSTTYQKVEKRIADALGESPSLPTALMARIEQIMQPSQRELFFTPVAILVEGTEDVAFISTHMQLTGKWTRFRELGCHFVVAEGKGPLSRPLAIAKELCIPIFVVFDSDADQSGEDKRKKNAKDNSCILSLCEVKGVDPLPTDNLWCENVVMWKSNITKIVPEDFGATVWTAAEDECRKNEGYVGIQRKNNLLIAATLEHLSLNGRTSEVLTRLCDQVLAFAEKVANG